MRKNTEFLAIIRNFHAINRETRKLILGAHGCGEVMDVRERSLFHFYPPQPLVTTRSWCVKSSDDVSCSGSRDNGTNMSEVCRLTPHETKGRPAHFNNETMDIYRTLMGNARCIYWRLMPKWLDVTSAEGKGEWVQVEVRYIQSEVEKCWATTTKNHTTYYGEFKKISCQCQEMEKPPCTILEKKDEDATKTCLMARWTNLRQRSVVENVTCGRNEEHYFLCEREEKLTCWKEVRMGGDKREWNEVIGEAGGEMCVIIIHSNDDNDSVKLSISPIPSSNISTPELTLYKYQRNLRSGKRYFTQQVTVPLKVELSLTGRDILVASCDGGCRISATTITDAVRCAAWGYNHEMSRLECVECEDIGREGQHCELDMNECARGRHQCPPKSACWNTIGSYTCMCKEGDAIITATTPLTYQKECSPIQNSTDYCHKYCQSIPTCDSPTLIKYDKYVGSVYDPLLPSYYINATVIVKCRDKLEWRGTSMEEARNRKVEWLGQEKAERGEIKADNVIEIVCTEGNAWTADVWCAEKGVDQSGAVCRVGREWSEARKQCVEPKKTRAVGSKGKKRKDRVDLATLEVTLSFVLATLILITIAVIFGWRVKGFTDEGKRLARGEKEKLGRLADNLKGSERNETDLAT